MKPSISWRTISGRMADRPVHRRGARHRLRRGPLRAAHLHQRQQVDRVEGMADDEALGAVHAGGQPRRQQPRGRGGDDRVGRGRRAGLGQQRALELLALGRALLDEVHPGDRLLDGVDQAERALLGQRGERQALPRPPRALDGVATRPGTPPATGSKRRTSTPASRNRAAQPPPITPAPSSPTERGAAASRLRPVSHGGAGRAAPGPPPARARGRSSR